MADVIGEAIVAVKANTAGFLGDISNAVRKANGEMSKLGKIGTIATAGLTAPILAIGAFALESSKVVGGAMTNMVRAMNVTGGEAERMKSSFKNVFGNVPESASDVSSAMTTVHNRLGLTGTDLENVTKQGLELARMMGTSVTSTVEGAAKAFEAWHVPTNQMGVDMDKLYMLSTKTGVPVDQLTGALTKSGAMATTAGVSFDVMSAAVGSLGAAGIPARQGTTMVQEAIVKLEKEGKNAGVELPKMFERIATGTATAADKALLGQKNFDKFTGALKNTRTGYDALKEGINDAKGALDEQADSTMKFSEKLAMFKNKLMVAFEPLGKALIDVGLSILKMVEPAIPVITKLIDLFVKAPAPIRMVVLAIGGILAALGPVLLMVTKLHSAFSSLNGVLGKLPVGGLVTKFLPSGAAAGAGGAEAGAVGGAAAEGGILAGLSGILLPVLLIVIGITAEFIVLYAASKTFRDTVSQILGIFGQLVGAIGKAVGLMTQGKWGEAGAVLKKGFEDAWNSLSKMDWGTILSKIASEVQASFGKIRDAIVKWAEGVDWGAVGRAAGKLLGEAIILGIQLVMDLGKILLNMLSGGGGGAATGAAQGAGKDLGGELMHGIEQALGGLSQAVNEQLSRVHINWEVLAKGFEALAALLGATISNALIEVANKIADMLHIPIHINPIDTGPLIKNVVTQFSNNPITIKTQVQADLDKLAAFKDAVFTAANGPHPAMVTLKNGDVFKLQVASPALGPHMANVYVVDPKGNIKAPIAMNASGPFPSNAFVVDPSGKIRAPIATAAAGPFPTTVHLANGGELSAEATARLQNLAATGKITSVDTASIGIIGLNVRGVMTSVDTSNMGTVGLNVKGTPSAAEGRIVNPMAHGGIVKAQGGFVMHGPTLVLAGEGHESEAFVPLSGGKIPVEIKGGNIGRPSSTLTSVSNASTNKQGGDINFQIEINNPTLTSVQDAEKLGRRIGYQATEMLRRSGHVRG